jgi:hypothetical protein
MVKKKKGIASGFLIERYINKKQKNDKEQA